MAKGKTICNVCGQPFTDLDICCSCFDSLIDKLANKCIMNPIQEGY